MKKATCQMEPCRPEGDPRPTYGSRVLCDPCAERMHSDLIACGKAFDALGSALGGMKITQERVSGSGEIPLPVRLVVVELRDQIRRDVAFWCGYVQRERRLSAQPVPPTVREATRWLAKHLDWLASDPDAPAFAQVLREHRRAATALQDIPADRTRFPVGPCPERTAEDEPCEGMVVAHIPRDELEPAALRCNTCATEWTRNWLVVGARILDGMRNR